MKIFGIQNYYRTASNKYNVSNRTDYSQKAPLIQQSDCFQKSNRNISFTSATGFTTSSIIKSVKEYKELPKNRIIHCFYCQRPMVASSFLDDLNLRGVFEGSIADFVKEIAPYESYLRPTGFEIFQYLKKAAKAAPQTHLSRALQSMNEEALDALRKKQLPIFIKIEREVLNISGEKRKEIQKILKAHKNRLLGIPQVEEFSPKDFAYKIKRLAKTVSNNIHHSNLSRYGDLMEETIPTRTRNIFSNNVINKTFQNKKDFESNLPINTRSLQLYIVELIKKTGAKVGRNEIVKICNQAEDMLMGKPVNFKFSNKNLRYDIEKAMQTNVHKKTRERIFKLIGKLPTSTTNINSFIAKHEYSSSTTIGYELLRPSVATWEHIDPKSTKGAYVNTLGNSALACGPCNEKRGNSSMEKFLKDYPATSPQVFFNDIVGVVNDGFISIEDLLRMKENIYVQSGRQMNISGISNQILRDHFGGADGQENFDRLVHLANHYLISGRDIYALQQMLRQRCGIVVKFDNLKYIFY